MRERAGPPVQGGEGGVDAIGEQLLALAEGNFEQSAKESADRLAADVTNAYASFLFMLQPLLFMRSISSACGKSRGSLSLLSCRPLARKLVCLSQSRLPRVAISSCLVTEAASL